jgi:peptidyl-prolyl cis-trans isomerase D
MLTAIRNKASSWVFKGLFVLLVAAFAVWGIGDIFRGGGGVGAPIEVGDVAISAGTLQQRFNAMMQQFRGAIDAEQAKQMGLVDVAVRGAIEDALVEVETRRLGLAVPTDFVRELIVSDPRFYSLEGKFERERFAAFLQNQGMSEGQYVAQRQSDIAQNQLLVSLVAGAVPPKAMLDELHAYRAETRVAKTLLLPPTVADPVPEPDEAALKTYYEAHKDDFLAPEYRTLILVHISREEMAKSVQLSDEKLQQEYEARKDQLAVPERRHVQQISVPDEASAKTVVEKAKTEPFDAAAKEIGGAVYTDLGSVAPSGLLPELAGPAFGATDGAVVGPIESKLGEETLGWYVLKVDKFEPGRPRTFEEAKEELRQSLTGDQAAEAVVEAANQLDDAIAGGAGLEDAAAKVGLKVQKIGSVDSSGKAPDGTAVAPLAGNAALLGLVFSTAEGETSAQSQLADESLATVQVTGIQAAAPRPFEDVRDKVVEAWKKAEQDKALAAKAESLAEAVRTGKTLEAIAEELHLTVKTSAPFTRDAGDQANDVDPGLTGKLFAAKPSEVATAQNPGGYVLAQLTEVRKAEPLKPEELKALQDEVKRDVTNDVLRQFVGALGKDIEVTKNQAVLDTLF